MLGRSIGKPDLTLALAFGFGFGFGFVFGLEVDNFTLLCLADAWGLGRAWDWVLRVAGWVLFWEASCPDDVCWSGVSAAGVYAAGFMWSLQNRYTPGGLSSR